MRLVINVRSLLPGAVGGLETAFREVFDRILRRESSAIEATILTSSYNHGSFAGWGGLANLCQLPDDASSDDIDGVLRGADLIYCPLMFLDPPRPRIPSVVFIPDLQHQTYPEFFDPGVLAQRIAGLRASATRAETVVTISEFSASQIRRSFRLPSTRVVSAPLDAPASFRMPPDLERVDALRKRLSLPSEWMLFPANNWPHKNHRRIFEALARFRDEYGEPPILLLTGAPSGSVDLDAEIARAGVQDLVRSLGWVEPSDMPDLYDGARCLVYTTLFEGFGIPLVEAMRRGTPILASASTSQPEIVGDTATLVDPESVRSIAEGLRKVLGTDRENYDAEHAERWSQRYSFDEAARITYRALVEAAARASPTSTLVSVADWPRVFVVTPSLNQAPFLRQTVDSVLSQSYPHLEYFVADGGSSDGSVEILASYGDRLEWVSRPDDGQAAVVSEHWTNSQADIVAYLNSDDTYLPDAVAKAVEHLQRHPEAAMVYGKAWIVNENSERLEPYPTVPFSAPWLAHLCYISQPAAFVRRDTFLLTGPLDSDLEYCMDYDLWIRMSKYLRLEYLEEFLACSREHDDTKTLRDRQAVFDEILEVTARHYGMPSRNWSVGAIIHRCQSRVERSFWFLPSHLKARLQAWLVQREEARVVGPRYHDLWAGTATMVEVSPDRAGHARIRGESPFWPFKAPPRLSVHYDGQVLCESTIEERGTFYLDFTFDPGSRPQEETVNVLLRVDRTFVPNVRGYAECDDRPLSVLIRREASAH